MLAGDPSQLGPIIRSPICKRYGFDISLLERWIQLAHSHAGQNDFVFDPEVMKLSRIYCLVKHYRAHPAIMGLYSKLFYNEKLDCCTPVESSEQLLGWEGLKNPKIPILFRHTEGKEEREEDSPSWFNQMEINHVFLLLKSLLIGKEIQGMSGGWVEGKDIGVICPYRKQVEKVKQMIYNSFRDLHKEIEVGSTEAFQVCCIFFCLDLSRFILVFCLFFFFSENNRFLSLTNTGKRKEGHHCKLCSVLS